jgi:hypothetical protein
MIECNEDEIARSLDAIVGWTSPGGLPCLFLFIPHGDSKLRRITVRPGPGTEPSMAKLGWIVQSAFYGQNSRATTESSPTPCREAASFNHQTSGDRRNLTCLSLVELLAVAPSG